MNLSTSFSIPPPTVLCTSCALVLRTDVSSQPFVVLAFLLFFKMSDGVKYTAVVKSHNVTTSELVVST